MSFALDRSRRGKHAIAPLRGALLLLFSGCLVDPDKPCEENQQEYEGQFVGCVCVPGSVPNAEKNGCDKCGEHEIVKDGACACDVGYARVSAGGPCMASMLGAACDAQTPCAGEFPYCAPGGYCTTSGCASSAECSGGYTCDRSASPSYCIRPPTGLGTMCATTADCASFEANFCARMSCVVSGCASTVNCREGFACCDLRGLGVADLCIPSTSLMAGKCPGTGADPVTR